MQKLLHLVLLIVLGALLGCGSTKTTTTNNTPFEEDISSFRVHFDDVDLIPKDGELQDGAEEELRYVEVNPSLSITDKVNDKLILMAQNNLDAQYDGFRLLLYSGRDREAATEVLEKYEENFEDRGELRYEQPNWKVKVGVYMNKLEAHSNFVDISKEFPTAIIIQEKINVHSEEGEDDSSDY